MSGGRVTVGHPVDVGSGAVYTASLDFRIPASLEVRWRRYYSTTAACNSSLGAKWMVPYLMDLKRHSEGYALQGAHGEEVTFRVDPGSTLAPGAAVANFGAMMELRREAGYYRVLHWHSNGDVKRFCFKESDEERLRLSWIENLAGHRVLMDYDLQGRLVRMVQELEGRIFEIAYARAGLIDAVYLLGEAGRKLLVQYEYDSVRLLAAVDAMGQRKVYEYDGENRLIAETNPLGSRFVFEYDGIGRCIRTGGSDGFFERRLRYQAVPPMTRVTDSLGTVTKYYLNGAGQVIQIVDPVGGVTTNTFDEHGRLVAVMHPDGSKDIRAYDEKGNLAASVDPCGAEMKTKYDEQHVPVATVDRNGNTWKLPNSYEGSLVGLEDLPRRLWSYRWDAKRVANQASSAGGWIVDVRWDNQFRWQEIHDEISLIRRTEFDESGNKIRVFDSEGFVSQTTYDELYRPIEIRHGFGGETHCRYNGIGQIIERIGPGDQKVNWQYGPYGHLIARTDSLGHAVRFEYDREGRLAVVVNRAGERLEYRRDKQGRIIEERLFDGRTQVYEYDLSGRRIKIHLSDGRSVAQKFDPAGRLLCREASDGLVEQFEYDKEGRVVKAKNDHSSVELKRHRSGRIIAEVQNGHRASYGYDAEGNRTGRTLQFELGGSKLKRVFDRRGRLVALQDERGIFQEFRWDGVDRIIERRSPGGISEYFLYNGQRRLYRHRVDTAVGRFDRTHTYDSNGNLTAIDDSRLGLTLYAYDSLNRLKDVRRGQVVTEAYDYDANDSILRTHRSSREIAPGGRVLRDGPRDYSYGPDGAVATIRSGPSTRNLKHDVNGRLIEVEEPDGILIRYEYDPFGRRTAKVVGGTRTEFIWEGWALAAEVRGGEAEAVYLCLDLRPLAQWENNRRFTPILDHRGAVFAVFNEYGGQSWTCVLDAYGSVLSDVGDTPNPFRLRGQYHDQEAGLYYNFHRHYDPARGDYTAPDPIGITGGCHFYAYPRNPLRWDDPFGLECGDPEQHEDEFPDEDPNARRGGPAALADEEEPQGMPRLGAQEGQDIVDQIHAALGNDIAGTNSTTTLTETEDGTLIVTRGGDDSRVTPDQRQAIADMQDPGGALEGRTVLVPDDPHNPGYIPNRADRDLPPQGPNGLPTGAEDHGEQRGIQAANIYQQDGDWNNQRHGPADTQWSSSDAGHGGCACPPCAAVQQQNNITNPTGVQ